MEKIVLPGERVTTVTLDGSECAVKFSRPFRAFSVRNDGDTDIHIALESGKSAGDDGVVCVPSGGSDTYFHGRQLDTCYLLGAAGGKATVKAQDTDCNSFRKRAEGGGKENTIEKVKVNGATLPIESDKSVDVPVPIKNSQLQNDSDFATKTYVGEQIADIDKLTRSIVEELPTDDEAQDNVIYMVMVADISGNDKYQEYLKIDGTLQMIGDTSVDLTDYAKKTDIPTKLPANGGNADTVNNHTVGTDVPANAKFTDTIYTLPAATAENLGGVKPDDVTVSVDGNGVLSAQKTANLAVQIAHPNNYLIYDDMDKPSAMVAIPKLYLDEVISGAEHIVHPAFLVNGVEQNAIYISKYQNIVENDRAYSLPMKDPAVNINFDQSWTYSKNKGTGWHLMTNAEWAAIALWCKKNGTIPKGNNNFGKDISETSLPQKAIPANIDSDGKINRVLTGSGRESWYHDGTYAGITDLNGNVWEWVSDIRLVYGELQVIPNAASGEHDTSANSVDWKAVNANATSYDDLFITPDGGGTTANSVKLDWVSGHWHWATIISSQLDTNRNTTFATTSTDIGTTAKLYLQAMGLLPEDGAAADSYGSEYFGANNGVDERCTVRGGFWSVGANAGVFCLGFYYPRSNFYRAVGARSAYINADAQSLTATLEFSDSLQSIDISE